jgi:phenylacetate-coenzyme A ligase PaaK-like adenylate-forming protein
VKPPDLQSIEHLSRFPGLSKDLIRANSEALISENLSAAQHSSLIPVSTTGSSGIPLQVWLNQREYSISLAHVLHGFLSAGSSIRDTFVHVHVPSGETRHFAFEQMGILRQIHLDLRLGEDATLILPLCTLFPATCS